MRDLLTFIGLKTKMEYHLKMDLDFFINEMNNRIEKNSLKYLEIYFEAIFILKNRSNNLLMGFLKDDKFSLKRNYSGRNIKFSMVTAKGLMKQKDEILNITIDIKPSILMRIWLLIFMLITFIFAFALLNVGNNGEAYYGISIFTFLFGFIPYLKMIYDKTSLKRLIKNEIDEIITAHNIVYKQ